LTDQGERLPQKVTSTDTDDRRFARLAFVCAVVLAGVVLDQVTKQIAIAFLAPPPVKPPVYFFGDFFSFQYATNTGAFLSLGSTLPDGARLWLLTGFNAVILVCVATYLALRPQLSFWVTFSLSLILSGGIGNLIDRIFRDGEVIDFMNLGIPGARIPFLDLPMRTGIFNVADVAIMVGLGILVVAELFRRPPPAESSDPPH
jgi:signal peptidase II